MTIRNDGELTNAGHSTVGGRPIANLATQADLCRVQAYSQPVGRDPAPAGSSDFWLHALWVLPDMVGQCNLVAALAQHFQCEIVAVLRADFVLSVCNLPLFVNNKMTTGHPHVRAPVHRLFAPNAVGFGNSVIFVYE